MRRNFSGKPFPSDRRRWGPREAFRPAAMQAEGRPGGPETVPDPPCFGEFCEGSDGCEFCRNETPGIAIRCRMTAAGTDCDRFGFYEPCFRCNQCWRSCKPACIAQANARVQRAKAAAEADRAEQAVSREEQKRQEAIDGADAARRNALRRRACLAIHGKELSERALSYEQRMHDLPPACSEYRGFGWHVFCNECDHAASCREKRHELAKGD